MFRALPASLALLAALLPSLAGAAVHARVVPEVSAGGGWASDLFPGSEFGEHGQTAISPALGADLSTGPVVKLLSRYRYTLSHYLREGRADAGSDGHDLELTTRLRLGRGFDLDVPVAAGYLLLDGTAPPDPDLPAVEALRWIEGGPRLRYLPGPESRLEVGAAVRTTGLRAADEAGWDRDWAWSASAGASRRLGARVEVALRFEHQAVYAVDPELRDHERSSDGIVAAVALAPWSELLVRASAGLEHVRYPAFRVAERVSGIAAEDAGGELGVEEEWLVATRRREDLRGVVAVGASHPLGEYVEVEASASWTETSSSLEDLGGDRFSTWLGLRAQLPYWL